MNDRSSITIDDLYELGWLEDPRFSPDGRQVAFVRVSVDRAGNTYRHAIWLASADGQSVRRFTDLGLPHEELTALNEISWGDREGQRITPQEDAEYGQVLAAWNAGNDDARLPGGESPAEVARRQQPFIELLASRPDDEVVLACLHGRALRVLLCQLLHYPLRCMDGFEHQNLCLYKLHHTDAGYTIRNFLDVSHLVG